MKTTTDFDADQSASPPSIIQTALEIELERLATLRRLEILDSGADSQFDVITELMAGICGTGMAIVPLVDENRQWFKSHHGLDLTETERSTSFCSVAIERPYEALVVEDARLDERFREYACVKSTPGIRFYAGVPLISSGSAIGTLCVADTVPKRLGQSQLDMLRVGAKAVVSLIEQRATIAELERAAVQRARVEAELREQVKARARIERRLQFSATHDRLTRLPNRDEFKRRLDDLVTAAEDDDGPRGFTVGAIDINQFQLINATFGRQSGDLVLIEVGRRIVETVNEGDLVARTSGDRFLVVLRNCRADAEAAAAGARISECVARPIDIGTTDVYATASVGFASTATRAVAADELISQADFAMIEAKHHGRSVTRVFDERLGQRFASNMEMHTALNSGLKLNEFKLVYQPIISLAEGRVDGFEALMRWNRPGSGPQSPEDFIAAAERNGMIVPLGRWALREACSALRRWQTEIGTTLDPSMSVNVSASQLRSRDFGMTVERLVLETGMNPRRLTLEITETAVMENLSLAIETLHGLRRLGIRIDLDDFGTGYSSLTRLRDLPIDRLKIDRNFISGGPGARLGDERLVRMIISLAHELGLEVVAEGVETELQRAALIALGCGAAQGYLFSAGVDEALAREMVGRTVEDFDRIAASRASSKEIA